MRSKSKPQPGLARLVPNVGIGVNNLVLGYYKVKHGSVRVVVRAGGAKERVGN